MFGINFVQIAEFDWLKWKIKAKFSKDVQNCSSLKQLVG